MALLCATTRIALGQMSPGELSRAHQDLDSPLKCGSCHAFGAGAVKFKCLECHQEIKQRLEAGRGLHAKVTKGRSAQAGNECARCHAEHNGRAYQLVRWKTPREKFNHAEAGWRLEGKHAVLKCAECHQPKNHSEEDRAGLKRRDLTSTLMGLNTRCTTCHRDQHRSTLGLDCARCHGMESWKPAGGFSHEKSAFALAGAHQNVPCQKCHKPMAAMNGFVPYKNFVNFESCRGCHSDPHGGSFAGDCQRCHTVESWKRARQSGEFDHSRTKFPLEGLHSRVACLKCHKSENFRAAVAHERCLDCHQDRHGGQFRQRDGGECAACHTTAGWRPSKFGVAEHKSAKFQLSAAHAAVPCAKCHKGSGERVDYHPASASCRDCHADRHQGQFAAAPYENRCEKCHYDTGWRRLRFTLADHRRGRFPLDGAHAAVACEQCHKRDGQGVVKQFRLGQPACAGCHADPHTAPAQPQTGPAKACEACHTVKGWMETGPFDHSTTGFALLGKHRGAGCRECHKPVTMGERRLTTFRGTTRVCASCHADVHDGQFRAADSSTQPDCARCHTPSNWNPTEFDHRRHSSFSLAGAHERVPCRLCHERRKGPEGRSLVVYRGTPRQCQECHR